MKLKSLYKSVIILLILIIVLVVITYYFLRFLLLHREHYNKKSIDYYVITMHQPERIENIKKQNDLLNKQTNSNVYINYIDAVVGKNIDIDELIYYDRLTSNIYENKNKKFTSVFEKRKNEVGCYLSHLKIYNRIKKKHNIHGYSIIFEDDFEISNDFSEVLQKTLNVIDGYDFDMLFLGIVGNTGEHVVSNVYKTTKDSFCTHGYLINNKHIDKIITNMEYIETIVDVSIFTKAHKNDLTIFRIDTPIVDQFNFGTTIR
jgi:hypothetical protein